MIKFKDLISEKKFNKEIDFPSVTVKFNQHTFSLKFDTKDVVLDAGYTGSVSPWIASLCFISIGKTLHELLAIDWKLWDEAFKHDQMFWDLKQDEEAKFLQKQFEVLHAALDVFRGREYLYSEASPLVCRCFGIRESDILEHLQKENTPTLDTLAGVSKAGMGCRSCVPQLKRWLVLHESKKSNRYYKNKTVADWLIEIDYMLSCFPASQDWKMEVEGMKNQQVIISFEKEVTQKDEERVAKELQDFLGASLDEGLVFFLRRARHFSKARG